MQSSEVGSRIIDYIKTQMPLKASNGLTLTINGLKVNIDDTSQNINKQIDMKYSEKGNTEGSISGTVKITDRNGEKLHSGHYKKLVVFPVPTSRGTYIVNGVENAILNQMRMKPGVYTNSNNKNEIETVFRFNRNMNAINSYMPKLTMSLNPVSKAFNITIDTGYKKTKMNILNFLNLLGFTDAEISASLGNNEFSDSIIQANAKNKFKYDMNTLHRTIFPRSADSQNLSDVQKRQKLFDFFRKNGSLGDGSVVKETLGISKNNTTLDKQIISKAVKKTVSVASGLQQEDNKDDIKFKEIYKSDDLIVEYAEKGIDNFLRDTLIKMERFDPTRKGSSVAGLLGGLGKTIQAPLNGPDGLMKSQLTVTPEATNPLFMESLSRQVVQTGPGGMSKDAARNEKSARNLYTTGVNRIDPIETPESGKIGITQHLTSGCSIDKGTIKSSFYKVKNGEASTADNNRVQLSPQEEESYIVAYNDSRYLTQTGTKIKFNQDLVPGRYMGKNDMYPVSRIQYVDAKPQNVLGTSANMIPFVDHDDGARALMGASMQKQAINLKNREAPLVAPIYDKKNNVTFDKKVGEEYGKPIRSDVAGQVTRITKEKIVVTDDSGKTHDYQYYYYYPFGQSYINNEVKVKVGQRVTPNQILAEGWQTDNGRLALGKNARIGFVPYKGYNYEDGVVISQSFANAMTSEEFNEITIMIPNDNLGGKGSKIKSELMMYSSDANIRNLDADGILPVGSKIKAGSVLVGVLVPINEQDTGLLDMIRSRGGKIKYKYSGKSVPAGSYTAGEIKRITVVNSPDTKNKQKIVFTVVNEKPLIIGDKIAGRHGNKGTITKILPDELMPVSEDGKKLDLMMSPLAVPSRKNVGQLLETGAGLIAEKTKKPFLVDNFNYKEKDRVLKGLEQIGVPDGKMKVTLKEEDENGNIIDTPIENPVTVGNMYIMKLKQEVDGKIQARSNLETYLTDKTHMPAKQTKTKAGEKSNPQRLGEMEMRALQAHGAIWNILESSTIKADGGGDHRGKAAIFKALSTGNLDCDELDKSATPESMKVLIDNFKVLGVDLKPMYNGVPVSYDKPFNSVGMAPLNQKEFLNTIGKDKEVYSNKTLKARQFYSEDSNTAADVKGGLYDTDIFGTGKEDEDRSKWGYIKMPIPTANPVFMEDESNNIYSTITGIKKDTLRRLSGSSSKINSTSKDNGALAVITNINTLDRTLSAINNKDLIKEYKNTAKEYMKEHNIKEGDMMTVAEIDKLNSQGIFLPCLSGGAALQDILRKINVEDGLKSAKDELAKAKKGDEINAAYKKVKAFEMLQKNHLKPEDLMINYLPVTPRYLRPVMQDTEKNTLQVNGLNKLYGRILNTKKNIEDKMTLDANGNIDASSGITVQDYAERSKMLYNSVKGIQKRNSGSKDDADLIPIEGNIGGKSGLVRKEMLAKRQDFSGRSVITVNPNLGLDEVGIPLDMAKKEYAPFILKELIDTGLCKNMAEAQKRLNNPDKEVIKVIQRVADDRPMYLNRQPTLHKFSLVALKPIIKEYEGNTPIKSIQLNPLVCPGFNADFDGDTMATYVPVTERAKEEAKKLSLPSQSLINPTDGKMIVEIRHEMALGIYQLTSSWKKPVGAVKNYTVYDNLKKDYYSGKINSDQKVKIPIYAMETTAGQALFNWLIPEKMSKYRDFRKIWTKKELTKMFANLYTEAESKDFKVISKNDIATLINKIKDLGFKASTRTGVSIGLKDFTFDSKVQKSLDNIINKGNPANIDSWKKVEDEIEDKLEKGLLPDDNPLQIMMNSGARANKQQIRKMMSTVGVGMDVTNKLIKPIKESFYTGLSPQDYYLLGKDSRKGIYDRSVSTEKSGSLTREVWSATQDVVIREKDCGTKEYVSLKKSDSTIKGRYAGTDIRDKSGKIICKRNQMITPVIYNKIYNDDTIELVPVRSTLRCRTANGKCQKCYGAMPGTMQDVKIGTAVGVIASQAMGEPVSQMTMNTFHTGGANSSATLGLPRINEILNISKDPKNPAKLAEKSGVVTEILDTPTSKIILIDGKSKHVINKNMNGETPQLRVKKGDFVNKGDFLTVGNTNDIMAYTDDNKTTLTMANPQKMFKLKTQQFGQDKARNDVQDYLTSSMQYAIQKSNVNMDRRHAEIIIGKLTQKAQVTDSGDSPYMKGQKADVNLFKNWNESNCTSNKTKHISPQSPDLVGRTLAEDVVSKKDGIDFKKDTIITQDIANKLRNYRKNIVTYVKPIVYEEELSGKSRASYNEGWFGNLASGANKGVISGIAAGAAIGDVDKLEDPRSQLMAGRILNIGEGTNLGDDTRNKFTSKIRNFFTKK